jgi:hypothetical protein
MVRKLHKAGPQGVLEPYYELTEKEYTDLLQESKIVRALQNAGVDNWDGYSYAMQEVYGEDDDD